jgi:hypothetical protein
MSPFQSKKYAQLLANESEREMYILYDISTVE